MRSWPSCSVASALDAARMGPVQVLHEKNLRNEMGRVGRSFGNRPAGFAIPELAEQSWPLQEARAECLWCDAPRAQRHESMWHIGAAA
jgi:hypothetical protein